MTWINKEISKGESFVSAVKSAGKIFKQVQINPPDGGRAAARHKLRDSEVVEYAVVHLGRHGRALFAVSERRKLAVLDKVWISTHDKEEKKYNHSTFSCQAACNKALLVVIVLGQPST